MHSTTAHRTGSPGITMRQYHGAKTLIARFVAARTMRSALFLGLVFGAFVGAKGAGYAVAYPTQQARAALSASFSNNVGLSALLGTPHNLDSVTGFTAWNTLGVMALFGAIWGFIVATKTFRGEEDAGRREVLLAGQTTAAKAALETLAGLGVSLLVLYGVTAITFISIGAIHTINFAVGPAVFFALAATESAAVFMALGAFLSQLMPTRTRAISAATAVFGICFMIRAAGDTTNLTWLLNVTPLGWVEKLQPFNDIQPLWLLPIFGLIVALSALTVLFARQRDLGGSIFADRDSARPHTTLLGSPLASALRLTRVTTLGWLSTIACGSLFFGFLAKPAAQALSDSLRASNALARIAHTTTATGALAFLGIAFFLIMTLTMAYVASSVGRMREDEAEGYLDNLLVQPVSRLQWLFGRIFLICIVTVAAGIIIAIGTWCGIAGQNLNISFTTLLSAGFNAITPALFTLGASIFAFGIAPRLTTLIAYGVIGWSFLIEMISSGIKLDEWVLDTSVFHHIALAPATDPDWRSNAIIIAIGFVLCSIGIWRFLRRDLQSA